jgi:hypothetical protein
VGRIAQDDRDQHDECRAENESMLLLAADDGEQRIETKWDVGHPGGPRYRDEPAPATRRNELIPRRALRPQRPHADDLRGDVASRIAIMTGRRVSHQVLATTANTATSPRQEVSRGRRRVRAGDRTEIAVRRGDRTGRGVVGEPRDLAEEPDQEELRGERRPRDKARAELGAEGARDAVTRPGGKDREDVEVRNAVASLNAEAPTAMAAGAERGRPATRQEIEPDAASA